MSTYKEKDHYATLGLTSKATQAEIDNAYQKLAAEWHPEKHPGSRVHAQRKFNDISEAYYVLSNQARRDNYDHLTHKYNTEDAYRTFEKFYSEQGFQQPNEREFFDKQYPHRKRSYYEVLGVTKNSSLADIQKAYRDLAIKYHPKNSSDPAAEQKFTEINEAYTHLSDAARRRAYDEYRFGELVPFTSHSIFNDFFNTRPFLAADDDKFFRPLMWKSPYEMQREFDKDWMEIEKLGSGGNTEYAETYKSSTVQERKPEGLVGKTVTEKSSIKDGKKTTVKTEEILKPDGTKEVTETVTEGTDTKTNKYLLGPGQERKAIGPSK